MNNESKKLINYIIVIVIVFCIACSSDRENTEVLRVFKQFPISESLTANNVSLKGTITPRSISIIDTLAIVIDRNTETPFHLFSLPDWNLLKSFGKIGDGPNEVQRPIFHGQYEKKNSGNIFWFSDLRT